MVAGWAVSTAVAAADPDETRGPSPTASASPSPAASPAPSAAPSASPSPAASPGATPSPTPGSEPKTTIDKDGTYAVGSDIVPGTYSSAGPVGNGTCYWKRMGNPDGALLDNSLSKKAQVVQIQGTDKAFKTDGCQPWELTPDATPPPEASGPQVQAGLGILNGLLAPRGQPAPPHS
ncbi:hypothetical protein [Mycobacterium shigaense]|uniref:Uncharacterized protein n=1 Tax=Mycobacterium shigaense TaxID=722731 RepID=A0A1Z4EIW7_9MYCO|nr:hypothetical protein [Mycobacterium shigaense]MEA1123580.1 hypothetical protein [Mycobacterium shigaense]BAX92840.1 hypothetical protein MSG_02696 [Mycobacterium shigaense]